MKKILVTGGAGYIGAHTVQALIRKGYEPIVVDNLAKGHRHNVDAKRLHVMDTSETDALVSLMERESIRAVIHFAAFIAVGESVQEPELYFANNVGGTLSLLTAMNKAGVHHLVFSSTAAVYGNPERVPIVEESPYAPVSPYGESKVMVEKILGWLDQCRGLRSVSLRYFNACGADPEGGLGEEHSPETHLIPLALQAARSGKPITLFGKDYETPDGTCIRDYIHVQDLAAAHIAALEALAGGAGSGAYNVGTGKGHSVLEVIQAVEAVTGLKVPVTTGPRRAGDAPSLVADSAKLARTFGWKPRFTDLREIVSTAWEFERKR
jgi:UDP-glucose-4-epimerase GalE